MRFIFNELSLEGQFDNVQDFSSAISQVLKMRNYANDFGYKVECYSGIKNQKIVKDKYLVEILNDLSHDLKRKLIIWFSKEGPFWDNSQLHTGDDYVTNTKEDLLFNSDSICELCLLRLNENKCSSISVSPSVWCFTPIKVFYHIDDENRKKISIENYWEYESFTKQIEEIGSNIESWKKLEELCKARYENIIFSKDAFSPIQSMPFVKNAAERIYWMISILNKLCESVDENGKLNEEGNRIIEDYFKGDKSLFSDSSDTEKEKFSSELTFQKPGDSSKEIFCSMHGKVSTQHFPIRVHYKWENQREKLLYLTYVGQKITKA